MTRSFTNIEHSDVNENVVCRKLKFKHKLTHTYIYIYFHKCAQLMHFEVSNIGIIQWCCKYPHIYFNWAHWILWNQSLQQWYVQITSKLTQFWKKMHESTFGSASASVSSILICVCAMLRCALLCCVVLYQRWYSEFVCTTITDYTLYSENKEICIDAMHRKGQRRREHVRIYVHCTCKCLTVCH